MRIIIDIREGRDAKGKRAVMCRTHYFKSAKDCLRVHNCGVEIYNCIKEGFGSGFVGGEIVHEGGSGNEH